MRSLKLNFRLRSLMLVVATCAVVTCELVRIPRAISGYVKYSRRVKLLRGNLEFQIKLREDHKKELAKQVAENGNKEYIRLLHSRIQWYYRVMDDSRNRIQYNDHIKKDYLLCALLIWRPFPKRPQPPYNLPLAPFHGHLHFPGMQGKKGGHSGMALRTLTH